VRGTPIFITVLDVRTDPVRKSIAKRSFEAQKQLDALQATGTKVALERVIKYRVDSGAAEVVYGLSSDCEQLTLWQR